MTRVAWKIAGALGAFSALAAGVVAYATLAQRHRAVHELVHLQLADLEGAPVALVRWKGTPVLVNFWATWCDPCREEVPMLVSAQRRYGKNVQIVGIGIDSAAKMREFAKSYGIDYPLVVAGPEVIDLTRRLGNAPGGLPFSLMLDRAGQLQGSHLGELNVDTIEKLVAPAEVSSNP